MAEITPADDTVDTKYQFTEKCKRVFSDPKAFEDLCRIIYKDLHGGSPKETEGEYTRKLKELFDKMSEDERRYYDVNGQMYEFMLKILENKI